MWAMQRRERSLPRGWTDGHGLLHASICSALDRPFTSSSIAAIGEMRYFVV